MIPDSVFSGFPIIKTKRLMLRQPQHEDAEAVFSIKSDPLVTLPYCAEPYTRMEQARGWIERLHSTYRDEEGIMWFITPIGENNVIGDCTLWHIDSESECAELGYELNRSYWGRGIASEAASAVIEFGFNGMLLNRVEACPFSENRPSTGLLDRLGFTLEGNLRKRIMFRGKYFDQLYYGLLKEEWEINRTSSLSGK
ncbi:MAG: GNAT family N-acetyltransferase [Candidatus Thermoplasmatota archaeon]|nr:GNAT family N-acetyltransferase [Candidatus Thermoplasmatota archaeon]